MYFLPPWLHVAYTRNDREDDDDVSGGMQASNDSDRESANDCGDGDDNSGDNSSASGSSGGGVSSGGVQDVESISFMV
jgi:hypothetical protein